MSPILLSDFPSMFQFGPMPALLAFSPTGQDPVQKLGFILSCHVSLASFKVEHFCSLSLSLRH